MNTETLKEISKTMGRIDEVTQEKEYIKMVEFVDLVKVAGLSDELLKRIKAKCSIYNVERLEGGSQPVLMIALSDLEAIVS